MRPERLEVLRKIAAAAARSEAEFGLPSEIQAAQCILESGWLEHAPGNNPFGIKRAGNRAGQALQTTEVVSGSAVRVTAAFEVFETLTDAFRRHAQLITTGRPYARVWARYLVDHDLEALIDGIASAYATDPAYPQKLRSVLRNTDLQAELAAARRALTDQPANLIA